MPNCWVNHFNSLMHLTRERDVVCINLPKHKYVLVQYLELVNENISTLLIVGETEGLVCLWSVQHNSFIIIRDCTI